MENTKKAQELLEEKYPDEKSKKEATEINLTELLYKKSDDGKTGELKYNEKDELRIEGFDNLKEIKIDKIGEGEKDYANFAKVVKIIIANCPELKEIDVNTFIDNEKLRIVNCPNLVYLDCSYNKLDELDINELILSNKDNKSGENTLSGTEPSDKKIKDCLETLDLRNNNFSDFSFLNKLSLTNLKTLYLDSDINNNNIKSSGLLSLKNLKNLTPNLKELGIVGTNIDLVEIEKEESNIKKELEKKKEKIRAKLDDPNISKERKTELEEKLNNLLLPYYLKDNLPNDLEKIYCDNKKLKKELEYCKKFDNEGDEYYDYQDWKKLTDAQKWLDDHYPKDGEVIYKRIGGRKKKGKTKTIELDISNKWLKGDLELEQFTDLEKLNCSNNYLTDLVLKDCEKLTKLDLSNNKFDNVEFLKKIPDKIKRQIEVLKLSNNKKIPIQKLDFLENFTGLRKLHIEDCPFKGSLKPLENMNNLSKIFISHTDIDRGLEYLPRSCKELYCDFRYQGGHETIKIVKELGKHLEEGKIRHYNLDKWRQEKKDGVALIIPLDKLPDNKNNIKKFLDNWNDDRVKGLKDPEALKKRGNWISGMETGLKIPSFGGGILSLADYSRVGGAMSVVAPVAEFIVEQTSKEKYEKYKKEWDDFVLDSENIWDTYWELKETFQYIRPSSSTGEVSKALKNLKERIAEFIKEDDLEEDDLEKLIKQAEDKVQTDEQKYKKTQKWWKSLNKIEKETEWNKIKTEFEWIKKTDVGNFKWSIKDWEGSVEFKDGRLHCSPEDLSIVPVVFLEKFDFGKEVKYEELEKLIKQISEHREEKLYEKKKEQINNLRNKLAELDSERYKELVVSEINDELKKNGLNRGSFDVQLKEKIEKIRDKKVESLSELNKNREEIIREIDKIKTEKENFEKELNIIFEDAKKVETEEERKKIIERMAQLKDKVVPSLVDNNSWISWITSPWNNLRNWWSKSKNDNFEEDKTITKDYFPEYLQKNWDYKKSQLEEIKKAIGKLQKEVNDYRNFFFGEESINNQQDESIKADKKDKLESLLKNLEVIDSDEIKKQFQEANNEKQKEKDIQQLDNKSEISSSSQQSTINNKGKDKETNENIQEKYETRIEIPNYGSINK